MLQGHADHHVVDEGAVEAVEGTMATLVGGAFHNEMTVFHLSGDIGIHLLGHFATGTFNGDHVGFFVNFNFYAFRESDG